MDAAPAPSSGDDPRDFLIDQEFADYTDTDHATWRTLARRQRALLQGRILPTFLHGLEALGIGETGIPEFRVMNQRLRAATGWEVVAVPGLVPDLVFFKLLADRRFPAGFWIRKPEQIEYIEEPDVFHDVFGHVPLLMQPLYADYLAAYGRAGLRAAAHEALHRLARLYWYTVEFGLAQTPEGLRIVGAGIASSPSETVFALESPSPHRVGFDLSRVMRTRYRIDDFQETYFVLDGPEAWPALDLDRLVPLWRALEGEPDLDPGDLLPGGPPPPPRRRRLPPRQDRSLIGDGDGMNGEIFSTLQKAKVAIEGWRGHENTNTVRPHSSLGSPA